MLAKRDLQFDTSVALAACTVLHASFCGDPQFCSFCDRLEEAVMEVMATGDKSVLTPDLDGTGTTRSFIDAVIKALH